MSDEPRQTCEVPSCTAKTTHTLKAEPSGHIRNERLEFGFCIDHVDEYVRMGYKPTEAGQGRLMP